MADDKIALSIEIEADRAQMSLGELEEGFDGLQKKLKKQERVTDEGKAAFKRLSTEMAQTSAEIKNLELGFEGLDREQIASEFGGLAGGIGDVTASLVLMGGENETIEQMGASIEKAMAISMGIKGVMEGAAAANKLYTNSAKAQEIVTKIASTTTGILNGKIKIATIVTKLWNAALKANPLGILLTVITATAAALLIFARNTKEASREQEILSEIQDDVISGMAKEQAEMESLVAIAKDETQTRHARNKAIQELNKISPEYLGNLTLETINTKEATAAIDAYTESLVSQARAKALQAKLEEAVAKQLELESVNVKEAIGDMSAWEIATGGVTDAKGTLLKQQEDNIKAANDEVDAILNLIKAENKLTDETVILTETVTEANKISAEEAARLAKEKAERDKAAQKAWKDGAADRAMAMSKESQAKKDALMEDIEIADRNLEIDTEELDRNSILIEGLLSNEEILRDAKARWHEEDLARIAEENAARRETAQISIDLALNTLGEISSVAGAYADADVKAEEERFNNLRATKQLTEKQLAAEELKTSQIKDAIRKKQFENEKKMQLATAAMNGAQALISILAQYPKFDGGFAMIAALAGSVITTAASIAKIKSTTFSSTPSAALPTLPSGDVSPDGAGGGGGGAAIAPVSNTSTILGNQQVFVTETDITDTQNNVSVIEESATF